MTTQMIVRIDSRLKTQMAKLAGAEGTTASAVVRQLVATYVREHDPSAYIDELWKRIGKKLAAQGLGPADASRLIRQVRAKKQ
jgi:predicted transcriptional regulator